MSGCGVCKTYFATFHRGHAPSCQVCPYRGRDNLNAAGDPIIATAFRYLEVISDSFGALRFDVIGGVTGLPARLVAALLLLKRSA